MGVERADPARPKARGRAAEPASASESDLTDLLVSVLAQLAHETGARRAVAWLAPGTGAPVAATARGGEDPPQSLTPAGFAALAAGERARDLANARLPEAARQLVERYGFTAAVAVDGNGRDASAVILLEGGAEARGVRPRALAALEAAARRVASPIAAVHAARRLAQLDADVLRLDRLAGIGSLLAEIVHEVRNPLVSVKTFLQLLPENLDDVEFRENFLSVVNDEVGRIERLLDAVLEQARPAQLGSEAARRGSVGQALETVAGLLAHRAADAGVELAVDASPELPPVALPTDALRQVVLNLATNALEATSPGGDVRLAARSLGHAVETSVADRGPGVPAALRRRVFEPFFSTKPGRPGGLGLAISRRIVEEAGGTLAVVERSGGGAVFRVRLPAKPDAADR